MDRIRFSRLKHMAQSPLHYHTVVEQDETIGTLALRLGSGTHAMLFGQPFAVYDGIRRGKEWEAFRDANSTIPIVNRKEADKAERIACAITSHPVAARLIDTPHVERRIEWEIDGLPCGGTPDAWSAAHLVDLKTTRCADPVRFLRDAQWRAYHAQLAWYLDGLAQVDPSASRESYIVAVENSSPYAVSVFRLDESALAAGRSLYRGWLERLRVCIASDEWPGYVQDVVTWQIDQPIELDFGDSDEEEESK